jgi:hypothetical protein
MKQKLSFSSVWQSEFGDIFTTFLSWFRKTVERVGSIGTVPRFSSFLGHVSPLIAEKLFCKESRGEQVIFK